MSSGGADSGANKRTSTDLPRWVSTQARPAPSTTPLTRPSGRVQASVSSTAVAATGSARATPAASGLGLDSQAVRLAMVQRLRQQPDLSETVLQAMARVPRHRFVESALVNQAYADTSLPIGWGQTISKPSVVARMLSLLVAGRSQALGRVLEIGTGCGYQAAVLAQLARHVSSVERIQGLYGMAKRQLADCGVRNVNVVFGDGMRGYRPSAPYDAIVAAAGGDAIPQAWLDQLAIGGRLVAPCVTAAGAQSLILIEHTVTGFQRHQLEPVQFVPLKSGVIG